MESGESEHKPDLVFISTLCLTTADARSRRGPARVAQSVEREAFNFAVSGSSPDAGTQRFFFCRRARMCENPRAFVHGLASRYAAALGSLGDVCGICMGCGRTANPAHTENVHLRAAVEPDRVRGATVFSTDARGAARFFEHFKCRTRSRSRSRSVVLGAATCTDASPEHFFCFSCASPRPWHRGSTTSLGAAAPPKHCTGAPRPPRPPRPQCAHPAASTTPAFVSRAAAEPRDVCAQAGRRSQRLVSVQLPARCDSPHSAQEGDQGLPRPRYSPLRGLRQARRDPRQQNET